MVAGTSIDVESTRTPSRGDSGEKSAGELEIDEVAAASESPALTYPDGGLAAWTTVCGGFLFSFCTFGMANAWAVFQNYYSLNQLSAIPASTISWIGSIQLFLQFAMGILSGPLFDRGYFRHMMVTGSVFFVLGLFMTSLSKTFWQLILCQGVLIGAASGLLFIPSISCVATYFNKRRALAMGFTVVGSSVGGVCWPIFLNRQIAAQGFEGGVRSSACLLLGLLILANLAMRPRLLGRKTGDGRPPLTLRKLFSSLKYNLTVVGGIFTATGLFFPIFYIQVFIEENKLSPTVVAYGVSFLNAGSVLGRTLPNILADKVGSFNVLIPCCFSTAVLIFAMLGATSDGGAIAFSVLYGFMSGAYVSVLGPAIASLAVHIEDIGTTIGLAFVCVGFGALLSGPIAGALLAATGNRFYGPIAFAGACVFVGVAFFVAGRRLQARDKGAQKV